MKKNLSVGTAVVISIVVSLAGIWLGEMYAYGLMAGVLAMIFVPAIIRWGKKDNPTKKQ